LLLEFFGVKIKQRELKLNFMAGHGAEHGGHSESHASSSKGGHGAGIGKAFVGALEETVGKIFAEPMADLGLKTVEDIGKVPQSAANLGNKGLSGGGGGGGEHH
jgi:hypothetical protein